MNGLTSLLSVIIGAIITIFFGLIIGSFRYTWLRTNQLYEQIGQWVEAVEKLEKKQEKSESDMKLVFTLLDAIREALVRVKSEMDIEISKLSHEINELKTKIKGR